MKKYAFVTMFLLLIVSLIAKDFYSQYSYATIGGESKMRAKDKALSYVKKQFSLKIIPYVFRLIRKRNPDAKVEMTERQREYVNAAIDSLLIIDESWDGAVYKIKAKVFIDENVLFPPKESTKSDTAETKSADKFLEELKKWNKDATSDLKNLNLNATYISTEQKAKAAKAYDNAILYLNIGNYYKAIKYLKQTLKYDPYFKNAEMNLGISYLKTERFLDAIKTLKHVASKEKKNPNVFFNLAVAYLKVLNWDRAIENLKKTIELKKDYKGAYFNLGYAYLQKENYEKSLEATKEAVKLDSTNYNAFFNLGYAYDELKQYENAIKAYKKAIDLNAKFEPAYTNIGIAYYHLKNYKEALKYLKKSIELNPEDDAAYFNMGKIYFELKDKDKSIESYQKAARLGNIEAQRYLRKEHYSW